MVGRAVTVIPGACVVGAVVGAVVTRAVIVIPGACVVGAVVGAVVTPAVTVTAGAWVVGGDVGEVVTRPALTKMSSGKTVVFVSLPLPSSFVAPVTNMSPLMPLMVSPILPPAGVSWP